MPCLKLHVFHLEHLSFANQCLQYPGFPSSHLSFANQCLQYPGFPSSLLLLSSAFDLMGAALAALSIRASKMSLRHLIQVPFGHFLQARSFFLESLCFCLFLLWLWHPCCSFCTTITSFCSVPIPLCSCEVGSLNRLVSSLHISDAPPISTPTVPPPSPTHKTVVSPLVKKVSPNQFTCGLRHRLATL